MKIYSKLALIIGCALAFTACSDDDDFKAGVWDGTDNDAEVYFSADSITFNEILDPTDPTVKTFNVHRQNTEGDLTVKFTLMENTDNVFTVSDAVFADGEADATFDIDFTGAEMDKTYKLLLKAGEGYSSSWSSKSVLFAYTVLIEKWNNLGVGLYVDDLVGNIFGAPPVAYEIEILEKASKPGLFRLVNPYGEAYPYNDPGDWDDSQDYLLEVDASDPENVTFAAQALGLDWGYGMFYAKSVAAGTFEDGIITFPVNGFYVAMENYNSGAWSFYGNTNEAFEIILPETYAAMLEEGEEVKALKAPSRVKVGHKLK